MTNKDWLSDYVDDQAELSLYWALMPLCCFVPRCLDYIFVSMKTQVKGESYNVVEKITLKGL